MLVHTIVATRHATAPPTSGTKVIPLRSALNHPCDHRVCRLGSCKPFQQERPDMPQSQGTRFTAEPLTFIVRHQLWDGNVEDHSDQGVSIDVAADVGGKQTALLRFNCFDIEKATSTAQKIRN